MSKKNSGYRKYTLKLRKILNHGHFVHYPFQYACSSEGEDPEAHITLWRAVVDQHLKDIISHHMIKRNFYEYYEARVFFDDQVSGVGQECAHAFLEPTKTRDMILKLEKLCRELRDKGITLSEN